MAIQVKNGEVIVRAPYSVSKAEIESFVEKESDWIAKQLAKQIIRKEEIKDVEPLSELEMEELKRQAMLVIPARVAYYAPQVGVTYGRITIRNQKTRWGSCSTKGNLNFNVALMRAPLEVLDYVVIHELTHRIHMNHSEAFWADVARVMPNYKLSEKWLKKNGDRLFKECNIRT